MVPAALLPSQCSSPVTYVMFKGERKAVCFNQVGSARKQKTQVGSCVSVPFAPQKCKLEEVTVGAAKARSQRSASGWAVGVFPWPGELAQCCTWATQLCWEAVHLWSDEITLQASPCANRGSSARAGSRFCIEPNCTAWTSVFPSQGLVLLE